MPDKKTIFITGATGLLGSYLLKILLENGYKVYALARKKDNKTAKNRVFEVLKFWDEKVFSKNVNNLIVLDGDITQDSLGLDSKAIELFKKEVKEIFHCAAATQFNAPIETLREINVKGTKNILELVREFNKDGILRQVNYISTAFVCGTYEGVFKERDFNVGQNFNNNYEQSKFEAELLVREYREIIPISIFRPGIIVGDYSNGMTTEFKMFYEPLRLFSLEIFDKVPLDTKTFLNLMPVDILAKAIYLLSTRPVENTIYHLTSSQPFSIDYVIDKASRFFNFKKPYYVDFDKYKIMTNSPTAKRILQTYIPYFHFYAMFDSRKTNSILKEHNFEYPLINGNFLQKIFEFCSYKKFIKIKK
jgi:thioester reductase-like protein